MSSQPISQEPEMNEEQNGARLREACDDIDVAMFRGQIERASRSGLAEALAPHGI